jgi:hypothetical protein
MNIEESLVLLYPHGPLRPVLTHKVAGANATGFISIDHKRQEQFVGHGVSGTAKCFFSFLYVLRASVWFLFSLLF